MLVLVFWLLLAGQQDFEASFQIPVEVKNVPAEMTVTAPIQPKVRIRIRGLRKDASTLNEKNVRAELDLSLASLGRRTFSITPENIQLPKEAVRIVNIEPRQIVFGFKKNSDAK